MKTDRSSNILSGTSLIVSLVCLTGLIHVEYQLYGQQNIQTKCPDVLRDEAARNLLKELDKNWEQQTTQDHQRNGKKNINRLIAKQFR